MPKMNLTSPHGRLIPCDVRLHGSEQRVCLIAHGFASSKESSTAQMLLDHLEKLGLGAVAFDFPCHGTSTADYTALTVDACLQDMRTIEDYIREAVPGAEICHFGSSYGAYLSLLRLIESGEPRRAFLCCAAVDMDHAFDDVMEAIEGQIGQMGYSVYDPGFGPGLRLSPAFYESLKGRSVFEMALPEGARIEMIHGLADPVVDVEQAKAYAEKIGCRINLIPDADHSIATPEGISTLLERTEIFFKA